MESKTTNVRISLRQQNLFPPRFNPLVYTANNVPEVLDSLPVRIATVSQSRASVSGLTQL